MLKQIIKIILGFEYRFFSIDQIVLASGQDRREVKWRLDRLEREGLISRFQTKDATQPTHEAGRPTKQIEYVAKKGLQARFDKMTAPQKKETGWDKQWRTMRVLRRFTRADLVELTGCRSQNVKDFIRILKREGYVRVISTQGKIPETLFLCKDPGPARPRTSKTVGAGLKPAPTREGAPCTQSSL